MVKTVTVNSKMKYEDVVRNLERLGELRVERTSAAVDGSTKVTFRERTLGEFFKESLPWIKRWQFNRDGQFFLRLSH